MTRKKAAELMRQIDSEIGDSVHTRMAKILVCGEDRSRFQWIVEIRNPALSYHFIIDSPAYWKAKRTKILAKLATL